MAGMAAGESPPHSQPAQSGASQKEGRQNESTHTQFSSRGHKRPLAGPDQSAHSDCRQVARAGRVQARSPCRSSARAAGHDDSPLSGPVQLFQACQRGRSAGTAVTGCARTVARAQHTGSGALWQASAICLHRKFQPVLGPKSSSRLDFTRVSSTSDFSLNVGMVYLQ